MKKFNILKLFPIFAIAGAGLLAVSQGSKKAESAEAATTSVSLAGSFNGWNVSAEPFTLNGDYWTIEKTFAKDDEFKVVVNGSDWVGDGAGVSWCAGMGSVSGPGSNFKVLDAGKYLIKAVSTIGDYGDKSYGIVFETVADVQYTISKYEVLDTVVAGSAFDTEKVNKDAVYNVPAKRFKAGYSFDGWFTDPSCETLYTNSPITADLDLYAGYTSGSWSGTLKVELGAYGCSWSEAAANYAIYFFTTEYSELVEGWSNYVSAAENAQFVDIPFALDFEPYQMIIVRYNPSFTAEAWAANKWASELSDTKWGQTFDFYYPRSNPNSLVRIGAWDEGEDKNAADTGYPKVIGGVGGEWNDLEFLDNYKVNGDGHPEFYDTCFLSEDTAFKVQYSPYQDWTYLNAYSTHKSIEDYFSEDGEGNIVCNKEGSYVFYYDDNTLSFYITTQALADADEWAQEFLTVNCQATMAQWSTMAARFNAMSAEARALFVAEEHVAHNVEVSTYLAKAVQRYDYIIELYGVEGEGSFSDFMGRVEAKKIVAGSLGARNYADPTQETSNSIVIIAIISLVSVSTLTALIVLKKRRALNK